MVATPALSPYASRVSFYLPAGMRKHPPLLAVCGRLCEWHTVTLTLALALRVVQPSKTTKGKGKGKGKGKLDAKNADPNAVAAAEGDAAAAAARIAFAPLTDASARGKQHDRRTRRAGAFKGLTCEWGM